MARAEFVTLAISPLQKALAQLEKSMAYLDSDLSRRDPGLQEQFRAAAAPMKSSLCWALSSKTSGF